MNKIKKNVFSENENVIMFREKYTFRKMGNEKKTHLEKCVFFSAFSLRKLYSVFNLLSTIRRVEYRRSTPTPWPFRELRVFVCLFDWQHMDTWSSADAQCTGVYLGLHKCNKYLDIKVNLFTDGDCGTVESSEYRMIPEQQNETSSVISQQCFQLVFC